MNKKILVISAVWCPSCLILKKHLRKLKEEYPNTELEMLDYDLDEDEVKKYDILDKLPVVIVDNNKLIGEKSYDELIKFLKENNAI